MKKYLVILVLLLCIKVQAQPQKAPVDTTVSTAYHGNTATVTVGTVPNDTTVLSQKIVTISPDVRAKFGTKVIDEYLKHGIQPADRPAVFSILDGSVRFHYTLYVKDDVVKYTTASAYSVIPIVMLVICILIMLLMDWWLFAMTYTSGDKGMDAMDIIVNTIMGIGGGIALGFKALDNSPLMWDQLLPILLYSVGIFLLVKWLRKKRQFKNHRVEMAGVGGGGGNA